MVISYSYFSYIGWEMDNNSLVVKENSLIQASYNLTLVEQRLILLAIIVIREHTHNNELDYIAFNKPVRVYAEDYIKQFGIKSPSTAYEGLKDACKALFARQFSYQEKRKKGVANVTSRWVSDIAYIDNEALVEVTFARAIIPLITELEKNLTSYEIKQVSGLTSGYAIRLYELLVAWKNKGVSPKVELGVFRARMGLTPEQYTRMDNFKRIVLDPAVKQINEQTDITVKYKQFKKGRKVDSFQFSIKTKIEPKERNVTPNRDPDTPDMFHKMTDKQIDTFGAKLAGDSAFGSKYAKAGETARGFEQRVRNELRNPDNRQKWADDLKRVGFAPKYQG